jgi:DNA-binding transcriptional LysR family regulator
VDDAAMLNLNDLFLFVQAIEQGGFAAAARHLGTPKTTISKRVAELEKSLGARLIHRTSRSFRLTDAGAAFFDRARAALIEAEGAESAVRQRIARPSGTVRLTAAVPVAQFQLADHLPELARAYPDVMLIVHATDRFVDLVQEGFDIAVRSHFAPLPDSALVQRRVSAEPVFLVAAPAYVAGRSELLDVVDIAACDGLLTDPAAHVWRLRNEAGRQVEVAPKPRLVADESRVLLQAAAAGLGVGCLPESICRADLDAGALIRVLPDWTAGAVTTTILMPHRRGQLPAVRAVVDFLAERLAGSQDRNTSRETDRWLGRISTTRCSSSTG